MDVDQAQFHITVLSNQITIMSVLRVLVTQIDPVNAAVLDQVNKCGEILDKSTNNSFKLIKSLIGE